MSTITILYLASGTIFHFSSQNYNTHKNICSKVSLSPPLEFGITLEIAARMILPLCPT